MIPKKSTKWIGPCLCGLFALGLTGKPIAAAPPGPSGAPAALRIAYVAPAPTQPPAHGRTVLWADDFESPQGMAGRYFEYDDAQGSFVPSTGDGYGDRGGALRCRFARGQVSAGSVKVLFGRNPFGRGLRPQTTFREIYWRVYVKHQNGWEGDPAKFARLTCLATTDWTQGFIAHVWSGPGHALCLDPATGITGDHKVSTRYNDFDHLRWLGMVPGRTPLFTPAESGRWVCVEAHVRLNTPGARDGLFELWVDGRPEASHAGLDWHGRWNDYAINAFFLENYWNQGAVKPETRWFDNLVISTAPIGPIVAARQPVLTRTMLEESAFPWQTQAAADPAGKDIVWTSRIADGEIHSISLDTAHGKWQGKRQAARTLAPGAVYWLRVRQRLPTGQWSAWTDWHCPFRTTGA